MKAIKLIQEENKNKVVNLELQVEELKEKIQLGSSNAASLSELLAESDKKSEQLEKSNKVATSELESQKKANAELKKEIDALAESMLNVDDEDDSYLRLSRSSGKSGRISQPRAIPEAE